MTEKDFKALAKGRQLLEGLQYRSSFGRSVTPCNGKWDDTDKAVIGYYEGATTIDTTNPVETEQYLIESSYFLNSLNEHLHLEGYHFDMTGVTNGAIYFAKDRDYKGNGFASSEDEVTYTQESAYRIYLMNKDKCNKQIRHMIDEALILTDDQLSITEQVDRLYILQEGIGDKLSDAWDKFVDFIRKIFNKFMEFVTRTVSSDKSYLEKYKEIILHRKYQADDVNIDGNYDLGIHRISTYQLAIPDVSVMKNWPTDNEDNGRKEAAKTIFTEYGGKTGIDFNEFVKSWFKGGEDGKTVPISGDANLANMYNFCYNFDKIRKNLSKNQTLLINACNNFKNHAKETFEDKRKSLSPADTSNGAAPKTTAKTVEISGDSKTVTVDKTPYTIDPTKKQGVEAAINAYKQNPTPETEKAMMDAISNAKQTTTPPSKVTITSADLSQDQSTITLTLNDKSSVTLNVKQGIDKSALQQAISKLGTNPSKTAVSSALSPFVDNWDNATSKITESYIRPFGLYRTIQEAVTKSGTSSGGSGSSPGNFGNVTNGAGAMRERENQGKHIDIAAKDVQALDEEEKRFNTQAGYFRTIGQQIFGAMLTAAETIKKDYMKIISIHVKSYMGEKESERAENKQAADAMTDYGSKLTVAFNDKKIADATNIDSNSVGELIKKLEDLKTKSNSQDAATKDAADRELYVLLHNISLLNSADGKVPNKVYNRAEDAIADLERAQQAQQPKTT